MATSSIANSAGQISEDLQKKNQKNSLTPAEADAKLKAEIQQGKQTLQTGFNNMATTNEEKERESSASLTPSLPKVKPTAVYAAPQVNAPTELPHVETQKPRQLTPAEQKAEQDKLVKQSQYERLQQTPEEQQPRASMAPPMPKAQPIVMSAPTVAAPTTLRPVQTTIPAQQDAQAKKENEAYRKQLIQQSPQDESQTEFKEVKVTAPTITEEDIRKAEGGGDAQQRSTDTRTVRMTPEQFQETKQQAAVPPGVDWERLNQIQQQNAENGVVQQAANGNAFAKRVQGGNDAASTQSISTDNIMQLKKAEQPNFTPQNNSVAPANVFAASQINAAKESGATGATQPQTSPKGADATSNVTTKKNGTTTRSTPQKTSSDENEHGGREHVVTASGQDLGPLNKLRESLGLKPVHVSTQEEDEAWQKEKHDGKAKVDAALEEAKRKANKKTWRDYLFGSKTDQEWNRKRKEKILALRDVLAGWSNLYATTKGAPAMDIKSSLENYEEKQKAQDKAKAAADKDAKDRAFKQQEADRDYNIKLGNLNIKQDANKREAEKQPYELAKLLADKEKSKTQAETEKALQADKIRKAAGDADAATEKAKKAKSDAEKSQSDATWADKLNAATLAQRRASAKASNASAANSYASAATQKARRAQIQQAIRNNGDLEFPTNDPNKNWNVPKRHQTVIREEMRGVAKGKKWAQGLVDPISGNLKKGVTDADLLSAAWEHYDDKDVQETFRRYSDKVVSTKIKHTNPIRTTYK